MSDYLSGVSLLTNRYIWRFIHKAGFQYTANPTKNRYKRNRREKVYRKWLNGNNLMLICGHTHRPRMSRPGESPYFNTGCAIHPRGITCIELNFGELALVSWTLQTRRDGMLYVKRNVMKNAVRLEDFMGKRHGRKRP